jgi:hypothetical protein
MKSPIFIPGPVEPQFGPGRMLTFEGFSVDENGRQHYLDVNVAYRQTCMRVIEYLKRFGYSGEQIYLLLSCAPVQGHIAGEIRRDPWLLQHRLIAFRDRGYPKCVHHDGDSDGHLRFRYLAAGRDCRWGQSYGYGKLRIY